VAGQRPYDPRSHALAMALGFATLTNACSAVRHVPKQPESQGHTAGRVTPESVTVTTPEAVVSLRTEFPEGTTLHGAYADYGELGAANGSARPARCAPVALGRFAVDGVDNYRSGGVRIDGTREIELIYPRSLGDAVLDVESAGARRCLPVRFDWPAAWRRVEPWEFLLNAGADFELTKHEQEYSIGGVRLDVFRWFGEFRLGAEVGLANGRTCAGEDCDEGGEESTPVLPLGVEADWFFLGDRLASAVALLGAGVRAVVYAPVPGVERRAPVEFSPQLALRLVVAFAPEVGPSRSPAGLTLDHGVFFGPTVGADGGPVGALLGFSIGAGWSQ
jgi:hypothetical protein